MTTPTTPPPSAWGQWKFLRCGLKHQRMDYLIRWDRLNSPHDRAWWLIHMAGKNRRLYGERVAHDLQAAFHAVLGRSPGTIDAHQVAGKYWDRIKPQRYQRREPSLPPLRKHRRARTIWR